MRWRRRGRDRSTHDTDRPDGPHTHRLETFDPSPVIIEQLDQLAVIHPPSAEELRAQIGEPVLQNFHDAEVSEVAAVRALSARLVRGQPIVLAGSDRSEQAERTLRDVDEWSLILDRDLLTSTPYRFDAAAVVAELALGAEAPALFGFGSALYRTTIDVYGPALLQLMRLGDGPTEVSAALAAADGWPSYAPIGPFRRFPWSNDKS